jgi:hypothetical protein
MGNRAVLQFGKTPTKCIGIYLHWNGSPESVDAFLAYAREVGVRTGDRSYSAARVAQICANFFQGTVSIGIDVASTLDCDNGDNGTYVIEDLRVIKRLHISDAQREAPYDTAYFEGVLAEVRIRNASAYALEVAPTM